MASTLIVWDARFVNVAAARVRLSLIPANHLWQARRGGRRSLTRIAKQFFESFAFLSQPTPRRLVAGGLAAAATPGEGALAPILSRRSNSSSPCESGATPSCAGSAPADFDGPRHRSGGSSFAENNLTSAQL
jgi:hypothetical protein